MVHRSLLLFFGAAAALAACSGASGSLAAKVTIARSACSTTRGGFVATGQLLNPTALSEIVRIDFGLAGGAEYQLGAHRSTPYLFGSPRGEGDACVAPRASVVSAQTGERPNPGAPGTLPPSPNAPAPG
ncbi:MAG: hypothetical protein ACYDH5_14985 [Acidimicrobiales bacterium]